jgi:chromosome segregation ATPase
MTSLGKLLVYLNTFVAIVLFGWAVSLYTNRVDWFDRTTDDGKVEGQLTQLQSEVKRYAEMIKSSQGSFAAETNRVKDVELNRDFRNFQFQERMAEIQRVDDKVRFRVQLRESKSALIDVRNVGADVNGLNGKPLRGLASLRQEFDKLSKQTLDKQANILKLRADYAALCDQVDVAQAEVNRQKIIAGNLKDEQEYLADARINWEEQLRTLEVRKAQLLARISALGPPPKPRRETSFSNQR